MNIRLTPEDDAVLDLLLDRSPTASGQLVPVYASAGISADRVQGAQALLGLLSWLPSEEPSRDLVARTLRRVGDAEGAAEASRTAVGLGAIVAQSHHPHA